MAEPSGELVRPPPPKKQCIDETDTLAQLVVKNTLWLKDSLKNLSQKPLPTLLTLSSLSPPEPKDDASTLAYQLWKLADDVENAAVGIVWSMRYTAACSSLLGAASMNRVNRQNIFNWHGLVHIINSIVNLMLPTWNNKAYLLYHVFAAKGSLMSSVARLSEEKRQKFASEIANALKCLTPPSGFEGVPLFNPTRALSGMMHSVSHEQICNAIWLPLAKTIEPERSISLFPDMATLSCQVKDLSVLPARIKSGNIASTPHLPPPPSTSSMDPGTRNQSSTQRVDEESRIGRTKRDHSHKIPTSRQSCFASDDQPTETFSPAESGDGHHDPGSSSASTSAGHNLDDITRRHIEDDSMDPWMADSSRNYAAFTGSGQTGAVSMDSQMTSSLGAVDCRPNSLQQDPCWERELTMDPYMMNTLGAGGGLPSALESRPSTINPNLLTVDPHMTSSLGAVDCLPSSLQQESGRERASKLLNMMEDIVGYSHTFPPQLVWP